MSRFALALLPLLTAAPPAPLDWPMFGGTPARNMANLRDKLPELPAEGPNWDDKDAVKKWQADWVRWKVDFGSRAYGGVIVAGGKVYVGMNNDNPRNPRDARKNAAGEVEALDKGILACFDAASGKFLWQAVHDKRPEGHATDWPQIGVTSAPAVVVDRVYYVSNRCTVVCLDANGFADGNQGIRTEKYATATDADVVWEYDMMGELGVQPHNVSNCSPLVVGDRVFICTSNGVDDGHVKIPAPDAPSLIALDRTTGKLLWKDASPGKNILHGQWSSPTYAEEPVPQVIHGQGDGWLRAFDPANGKLLWAFDGNRKGAKYELGGTGEKNPFVATPVVAGGRVYVGTGDDPEHGSGLGNLWCVDLKKAVALGAKAVDRNVSPELVVRVEKLADGKEKVVTKPNPASASVWHYGGVEVQPFGGGGHVFDRTLSTVAVVDGVVYAADLNGYFHCLNARTGERYWRYDAKGSIWASPYYADGKVLLSTESGDLFIFTHDPKPEPIDCVGVGAANGNEAKQLRKAAQRLIESRHLLARIEMPTSLRATPVLAGGVLYVPTENAIFALGKK